MKKRTHHLFLTSTLLAGLAIPFSTHAAQFDIAGPVGSDQFGSSVTVLPNGNFVITDPGYTAPGPVTNVGAVHLYDGVKLTLISTLTGSHTNDLVGSGGIALLGSGDYAVISPYWANGTANNAGAVTRCSKTNGLNGVVAATNSLVSSKTNDFVGSGGIAVLANGSCVVMSPAWNNAKTNNAGAVTWFSATNSLIGLVAATNSLVGAKTNDAVGSGGIVQLPNTNYLVLSPNCADGHETNAGAVTWGSGTNGVKGAISGANSLLGNTSDDHIGSGGIIILPSGNYVVVSPLWSLYPAWFLYYESQFGAVTWCNGATGRKGVVDESNSLVGNSWLDQVGGGGVTVLSNGNYVVFSPQWHDGNYNGNLTLGAVTWCSGTNGVVGMVSTNNSLIGPANGSMTGIGSPEHPASVIALANGNYVVNCPDTILINGVDFTGFWVGSVTWGNGSNGITGVISATNSLVGNAQYDYVGLGGVTPLPNGNYVVSSPEWNNNGAWSAGAVTWCNGTNGLTGYVSVTNSLIGSNTNDAVGYGTGLSEGVPVLPNGNYVVSSPNWANGAATGAGAVTWGNGTNGTKGYISVTNSLVGANLNDTVGAGGVTPLPSGNYVVSSPNWANGASTVAGAVTWCKGGSSSTGAVSIANSLVGSHALDELGANGFINSGGSGVFVLNNGNYVVVSPMWANGAATNAGAVTWGSGTNGVKGAVSANNSLVGSKPNDSVGANYSAGSVTALSNGNYVVCSTMWANGGATNAGATTWGNGTIGVTGVVSSANSLIGSQANDAGDWTYAIGNFAIELVNGNYLVINENWANGTATNAGAVTWGSGTNGVKGAISAANSLVGTHTNDLVGADNAGVGFPYLMPDGNYVVFSAEWATGALTNAGAVTLGDGSIGTSGALSTNNGVLGNVVGGGNTMLFNYDLPNSRLLVGYPAGNRVSLFAYHSLVGGVKPSITVQPLSITNLAGTAVSFTVTAAGDPTLVYQWRQNGTNMTNGGNISGTTTNALAFAAIQLTNAANYDVVVTNNSGSVTSSVASLTVTLPPGYNQISAQRLSGGNVRLSFAGFVGGSYALDWTFNLRSPINWTALVTNSAGAGGALVFTNTPNPATNNFWRIRLVP